MYDVADYIITTIFAFIALGIMILCLCGGYAIVKNANNPERFNTYEINGNTPTLITKGI